MEFKVILYNILMIVFSINSEQCTTPNNESGECVSLTSCPSLLEMFTNKSESSIEFVRKSICGFNGSDSEVCCSQPTEDRSSPEVHMQENVTESLLPDKKYCGFQHSDDYIRNTTRGAALSEFPWLVRLVHTRNTTSSIKKLHYCVGSLISVRYVLTTADCPKTIGGVYALTEAELGEFHVTNKTDCVIESSIKECSDPVDVYEVEKIVTHPEYSSHPVMNNIALVRLNRDVTYSDYVRPICLPYPETKSARIGDTLATSGWGYINLTGERAKTKKRVLSTIISNDECAEVYKKTQRIKITDGHFCTAKEENSTDVTCIGDSGAPVVFSNRLQWHQEGIVSNGKVECGSNVPTIHTKVRTYLKWIEENIQP